MEDALSPRGPPPGPLAAAAPATLILARRRSHLDSASYRTLSRLFSHCFHLHPSRDAAPAHPDVEPPAANPAGDSAEAPKAGSTATEDVVIDREKDFDDGAAVGSTSALAGVEAAAANPSADLGVAPKGSPEREVAVVDRAEAVKEAVVARSTCCKTGTFDEVFEGRAGLVGENEALRSMKACLGEELVVVPVRNDEQMLLDAMMTDFSGLIDDGSGSTMLAQSCGAAGVEPQNDGKIVDDVKKSGGIEEGRPVGNLQLVSVDDGGFEEGEIEGNMQDLDENESDDSGEDVDDDKFQEDFVSKGSGENESYDHDVHSRNLHSTPKIKGNGDLVLYREVDIKDDVQMHIVRAQAVTYEEVVDWNETPLLDDETTKPGKKRKQQLTQEGSFIKKHLTQERKARKTRNKRLKRAQQRIAEGVKRLKLQPVIKPKEVQYCRFYLHGKCQQGKICKFSHATTPLTKSMPCTHFARAACLKGDDCPYDHNLSKYPCHNFVESGRCVRGDRCKFSHTMPTSEGHSTPDATKSDAQLVFGKANQKEQTSSLKTPMVYNGEPVASAPMKHHSILNNLAGISISAQKTSARIPKGVKFLPFSKDRSDSSILHQDSLSTDKDRFASQHHNIAESQPAEGGKNVKQNRQSSAPLFDEKNISNKVTLHPCDSTAVPGSVSTQHEVSEASRILQNFLFGSVN